MLPAKWTAYEFADECTRLAAVIRQRAGAREISPTARFHLFEWYRVTKAELTRSQGLARLEGAAPDVSAGGHSSGCVAGFAGIRKCSGGQR